MATVRRAVLMVVALSYISRNHGSSTIASRTGLGGSLNIR